MEKTERRESATLADAIYLRNPFTNVAAPGTRRYLIYLVTGNPGLVEFYRPFLTYLYAVLSKNELNERIVFEVYGRSLGGFEVGSGARQGVDKRRRRTKRLYDLEDQIDFVEAGLMECSAQLTRGAEGIKPKVIIVGHSVGAYILMEVIRRHRLRLEQQISAEARLDNEPDILGGVCLFPTVVNIGISKKGRVLSALSNLPLFPLLVASIAGILTTIVPQKVLRTVARPMAGFDGRPLDATMAFLKSKNGVHQALHMGCDEMRQITVDKWDTEVWGAVHPSPTKVPRPKLFFYFGENDHWVADHTRDDLMRCRGRGESSDDWRPWMEIDKLEIPHGFCIYHSVPVAEKVKEYVDTMVRLDAESSEDDESRRFSLVSNRLSFAQEGSGNRA